MFKINKTILLAITFFLTSLPLTGCSKHYVATEYQEKTQGEVVIGKEEEMVDCLLPGQIRKLGQRKVYQTPRRLIKTSVENCKIRGGQIMREAGEAPDKEPYSSLHLDGMH